MTRFLFYAVYISSTCLQNYKISEQNACSLRIYRRAFFFARCTTASKKHDLAWHCVIRTNTCSRRVIENNKPRFVQRINSIKPRVYYFKGATFNSMSFYQLYKIMFTSPRDIIRIEYLSRLKTLHSTCKYMEA